MNDLKDWPKGLEKSEVGRRLKVLRKVFNKKSYEVAKACGVNQSTYSSYENGRFDITTRSAAKLSAFYRVNLDYILLGKDNLLPYDFAKKISKVEEDTKN